MYNINQDHAHEWPWPIAQHLRPLLACQAIPCMAASVDHLGAQAVSHRLRALKDGTGITKLS